MTQRRHSESAINTVLDHVRSSSEPVTARDISDQLNMDKQTTGEILRTLFSSGHLSRKLGVRGAQGGRPPYLYIAADMQNEAPQPEAAPVDETATSTLKFRGKSAVRAAYITLTGSTYGQGSCFTAGALTRHVAMKKYSPEAVYQAINKLEADGMVEHVGQRAGKPGRSNKRYRVLVARDESLVPTRKLGKRAPKVKAAPVSSSSTADVSVDSIGGLVAERDMLKARIAENLQQVAADELRVTEIENTFDAIRARLG